MPITDVQAIDVHAHLGIYRGAPNKFIDDLYSGGVDVVVGRAKKANTAISIVSSLRALLPRNGGDPILGNAETAKEIANVPELLQWAVKEIGADRILYGTDTPLYFSPMHRARIDHADLSDEEKTMILRTNALTLFRLTKS